MSDPSTAVTGLDLAELRRAIQAEYAEVALEPEKSFHFHTGRPSRACSATRTRGWRGSPSRRSRRSQARGIPSASVDRRTPHTS
jgi:hypothetical protein